MIYLIAFGIFVAGFVIYTLFQGKQMDRDKEVRLKNISNNGFSTDVNFTVDGHSATICIDEDKERIIWVHNNGSNKVIPFKEIIEFEVLKNGNSITKISKSGLITGAIIGGGVGAIIGANSNKNTIEKITRLDLLLNLESIKDPIFKVNFYNNPEGKFSQGYLEVMEKWEGMMKIILKRNAEKKEKY
jgi:hypothetical protein